MYKKKVLVFGSRGLVGKNLIKKLKKTHDVIEVLNPNSNNDNIISKENILYVDLFQQIDTSILENKIESIIYLSQPSKNVYRNGLIDKIYNINTLNPYNIALFAIKNKIKNFIYFSTGGVYPFSKIANKECHKINVNHRDIYVSSKITAEIMLSSLKDQLNVLILRPFFILGTDNSNERIFSRILKKIKNNQVINIDSEDGILINPIDVETVSNCVLKCLDIEKTDIFNIAGLKMFSLREIINIMGSKLNIKPIIKSNCNVKNKDKNLIGCTEKMQSTFHINSMDFRKKLINFSKI